MLPAALMLMNVPQTLQTIASNYVTTLMEVIFALATLAIRFLSLTFA